MSGNHFLDAQEPSFDNHNFLNADFDESRDNDTFRNTFPSFKTDAAPAKFANPFFHPTPAEYVYLYLNQFYNLFRSHMFHIFLHPKKLTNLQHQLMLQSKNQHPVMIVWLM